MASSKLEPRMRALLALTSLGLAVSGSVGCYSTTPHRVQVATRAAPADCASAIKDVFARSGFVELPTPARLSMFFTPRTKGPYSSFLATGSGIGVTVRDPKGAGTCDVTLEALSPDVGCPGAASGPSGTLNCQRESAPSEGSKYGASYTPACPVVPLVTCDLSSAPGEDNDAAVDELGRRLQAALGPRASVN
jgi:hypothetical protein